MANCRASSAVTVQQTSCMINNEVTLKSFGIDIANVVILFDIAALFWQ
jgi:hypothetical protein